MENIQDIKLGVLGAGQLGRMLALESARYAIDLHFLDKDPSFPAGLVCSNFTTGDFKSYDDVMEFGKEMDILTIEIEHVNTKALEELSKQGVKVYPEPNVIETIKDKGLQKSFYKENGFPTSEFVLTDSKSQLLEMINEGNVSYPFVQKTRTAGYDGKGVALIQSAEDEDKIMESPSVIEQLVDIKKELAVTVARNEDGDTIHFPVVEMVFNREGNLLDYLLSPAEITEEINEKCIDWGKKLINKLEMTGILAIEFFLDSADQLLINEAAPRTHNSGHHTLDVSNYSQFEIHLRSILNLPLLPLKQNGVAVMTNLLGENEDIGEPLYEGFRESLEMEDVFVHLYGKKVTKPLRKMGHVTIRSDSKDEALEKLKKIKSTLKVTR